MALSLKQRYAIAGVTLLCGVTLLWRGLARFQPSPPPVILEPASDFLPPDNHSTPVVLQFSGGLPTDGDNLESTLSAIGDSLRLSAAVEVGQSVAQELARESTAFLGQVFQGTHEAFVEYLEQRAGKLPYDPSDADAVAKYQRLVANRVAAYQNQAVRVDGVTVRWRARNGLELPADDMGCMVRQFDVAVRFPTLSTAVGENQGHIVLLGDTLEVLVPVMHAYEGRSQPIILGLCFTRTGANGPLRLSRMYTYSGQSNSAILAPRA